jgi:DNA-binding winged helix-turn-helix (wHTH) protein
LLRFAEGVPNETYLFDEFTLDVTERRLVRGREPVALEPKTFDVLTALVRSAGHLLNKQQLLDDVWPGAYVEEGILSVHIARLRSALGRADVGRHIETVSRAGYRFNGSVSSYIGPARRIVDEARHANPQIHGFIGEGRRRVLSASYFEIPEAVAAFDEAITVTPTYAAAHAGLALARCAQAGLRLLPHAKAFALARSSALRALALDDRCADAHAAIGTVLLMNDWDWVAAERAIERALALDPNHTEAYVLYGRLLDAVGDTRPALAMKMKALERDADSPFVHLEIALSYWHQRRYDEVIEWAMRTLDLNPKHLFAREIVVGACWKLGDYDRQIEESIRHARSFGVPEEAFAGLRAAHADGGRRSVVRYALEQLARSPQPAQQLQLALLNSELGNQDTALEHLDAAIEARDPALIYLAVGPQFDDLRRDPRFAARLIGMGLAG